MDEHAHHGHGHDHHEDTPEPPPSGQAPASGVKHVWCSPQGGAPEVGHIVRNAYTVEGANGPETKSDVWTQSDGVRALAFRDPSDFDENGAGGCFWNIVTDAEGSNRG